MSEFDHTRQLPTEWDGLHQQAQEILAIQSEPTPITPASAQAMLEVVDPLTDEQLEANRYFGLGKVCCEYAKEISSPTGRRTLIDVVSDELYAAQFISGATNEPGYRGLRLHDLIVDEEKTNFSEVIAETFYAKINAALLPSERLLIDGLQVTASSRLKQRRGESDDAQKIRRNFTGNEAVASNFVGSSLLGATILTYWHTILKKPGGRHNPLVIENLPDTEEDFQEITKVAMNAARIRMDEFGNSALLTLIERDETGTVRFRRDLLQPTPPLLAEQNQAELASIHEKRLFCPALHVVGMIPMLVRLMPAIIHETQSKLEDFTPDGDENLQEAS